MGNQQSFSCKKACGCLTSCIPSWVRREGDKVLYRSIPNNNNEKNFESVLKETQLSFLKSSDASTAPSSRSASILTISTEGPSSKMLRTSLIDNGEKENLSGSSGSKDNKKTALSPTKEERSTEYVSPPMSEKKEKSDTNQKEDSPSDELTTSLPLSDETKSFIYLSETQEKISNIYTDAVNLIVQLIQEPLDGYEHIYKDDKTPNCLQLFLKTYVSSENFRVNILRAEYISPCDPETYIRFMNNIKEQANIDSNIDYFYEEENFFENNYLFYIRYKKILFLSARDFVYAKNFRCLDVEKKIWADCATSIAHEKHPVYDGIVRGQVIKSGHLVEPIYDELSGKVKKCRVKLYSEMDLKLNVPPFMAKPATINEMKKYVEKCSRRLEEIMNEKEVL